MKAFIKYALCVLLGILIGLGIFFCLFRFSDRAPEIMEQISLAPASGDGSALSASATSEELARFAFEIVGYIKAGDFASLSKVVHPEKGVTFSPYTTVALSANKNFSSSEVAKFGDDATKYIWGLYAGVGSPIELTPKEYFDEFVYDSDYVNASQIGVDCVVRSGNSLENFTYEFPEARFVDLYKSGGKAADGLDWSSLRLGFEECAGVLYLTTLIHSEHTE